MPEEAAKHRIRDELVATRHELGEGRVKLLKELKSQGNTRQKKLDALKRAEQY